MLYRFIRLQRRRWEREHGRAYTRGRDRSRPRDAGPSKGKARKERRKRNQSNNVFAKLIIAALYISVAAILGAHLSGKRPLRILSGDSFGRLTGAASAMHGIGGLLGDVRLKAIRGDGASPPKPARAVAVPPAAPFDNRHGVEAASFRGERQRVIDQSGAAPTFQTHDESHALQAPPQAADKSDAVSPGTGNSEGGDSGASTSSSSSPSGDESSEAEPVAVPAAFPNAEAFGNGGSSGGGSRGDGNGSSGTSTATSGEDVDIVGEEDLAGSNSVEDGGNGNSAAPPAARGAPPLAGDAGTAGHSSVRSMADDAFTRRCYLSGVTEDSLCVHTPFCVRASGLVYVAESLQCAPYSNMHGIMGTLSTRRCVEVEHDTEHRAEIADPEHKTQEWLGDLDRDGKIQWYESETVFLTLTSKARSVAHYSQRVFFLHHVLLHPERYGMGRVSNVVIVAEDEVAKKIKFRKSWHYGLLAAIVHPNKPMFKHHEMKEALTQNGAGPAPPGVIRVFVPSGLENLAKGRQVPCFRRAAIPGAVHSQYLLTQDRYPGVISHGVAAHSRGEDASVAAAHKRGKFFDGAMLRKQVYASLDRDEPALRRRIVYLHRAKGRVLTDDGRTRLDGALREVATELGYDYAVIDLAGKSFSEQVEAVAGAAIAVGVHGMQLMSSLFMPGDGALIEIFPYKFWHELYADGCGSGLAYQSMSIAQGEDHAEVTKYGGLEACVSSSRECRLWYRSDDRALALGAEDASEVQRMVREAANGIARAAAAAAAVR